MNKPTRALPVGPRSLGAVVVLCLAIGFVLLRPLWQSPHDADAPRDGEPRTTASRDAGSGDAGSGSAGSGSADSGSADSGSANRGSRGDRTVGSASSNRPPAAAAGRLEDIGNDVKRSPEGLLYTPGSREGHRLKHVLRHADDDPSRSGPHGVFDGGQDAIIALLDEAYRMAKRKDPDVQSERQGQRQVFTVNLKRRVGYVGGRVGKAKGHPPARHVRLVLEDNRVITAFPLTVR